MSLTAPLSVSEAPSVTVAPEAVSALNVGATLLTVRFVVSGAESSVPSFTRTLIASRSDEVPDGLSSRY